MTRQQNATPFAFWSRVTYTLGWLSVLGVLGAVGVSITTGKIPLYNADTFQLSVLWRDLWRQGSFAGWDLPVNPPLFPDGLLFGLLWLFIPNLYVLYAAYGAAQVLLFLVGLIWLIRQLFGRAPIVEQWLLLMTTLFLLLLATSQPFPLLYILLPVHHFGVLLVLPLLLVLILRMLTNTPNEGEDCERTEGEISSIRPIALSLVSGAHWAGLGWGKRYGFNTGLLLALVTLLTAFSDALFIVQVTIPLIITLGLLAFVRPEWRGLSLRLGGMLIIASGAGQLVRILLVGQEKQSQYYAVEARAAAWQNLQRWVEQTVQQTPLFSGCWIAAAGALLALGLLLLRDARRKPQPGPDHHTRVAFVVTYLLLAASLSVAATLFAGNFFSEQHTRYLIPTIYLPWFLGWPLFIGYLAFRRGHDLAQQEVWSDRRFSAAWRTLSTLGLNIFFVSCPVYLIMTQEFRLLAKIPNQQDATASCLDAHAQSASLHNGMAHYWQASYLTTLSQANLELVQVHPDLSIYYYNNSLRGYDDEVDFVLIDSAAQPGYRLDQGVIINQFGPPASTFRCDQSDVLVYNRPADLPFRRHLQTQPVRARFDRPGASFTFYGASLPSLIGGLGIGLSKAVSEVWGNRSGELGFIPLPQLPAGTYNFAIHYYADSAATGRWAVSAQDGALRTVLAQGELSASGRQVVQGSFTLATRRDVVLAVLYSQGALYLDKVWLQRAGAAALATPAPTGNGQLTLIYPRPNNFLVHPQSDFVWQWTGVPLAAQQAFEVRIWREDDPYHYGAHNAAASRADLRQIDDTYTLHLDLGGAYSLQQHGRGTYSWSVAVVKVEPTYADLQIEAPPNTFYWEPE